MTGATSSRDKEDYNVFRHSLLRYAGYTNEIGESFRYQFPRFVTPSYVIAFGYCCADAATTGYNTYHNHHDSEFQKMQAFKGTADTLLWQSLASVMIPGATINLIVKTCRNVLASNSRVGALLSPLLIKWTPTATGISAIPVIVKPIDAFVDYLLDNTTRKWMKLNKLEADANDL